VMRHTPLNVWPVALSTLEATEQYWLFDKRMPLGHYVILEGDPDTKKSWVTISWGAAITTDGEASCTMPGYVKVGRRRDVIILTSEDGLRDTYIGRANLLGCDLERLHCIDLTDLGTVGLSLNDRGLAQVAEWLEYYDCPLVIFDPLTGWLGDDTDPGLDVSIRTFLRKLEALAQKYQCTFVGLRHLTKDSKSKAAYRGKGAIDWTAAARSVLLAGYSNEHKEWALITHKHNLAAASPTLGYRLMLDEFETPVGFEWYESTLEAGDLLSSDLTTTTDKQTKQEEAVDWMQWYLADAASPKPSSGKPSRDAVPAFELDEAAKKAGHAESTFNKAKTEAVKQGIARKDPVTTLGEKGVSGWLWSLGLVHQPDNSNQQSHSQKGLVHQESRGATVGGVNTQPSFSVTVSDEEENDDN
jgi:RecA-family ATPase